MSSAPEARVRALRAADTSAALELLAARPVQNVLLEHVVAAGALGRLQGFFGCEIEGALQGILMVGALGGASLEVRDPRAFAPLAEWAAGLATPPRHLSGPEDVTAPFFSVYAKHAVCDLLWERRERVYVVERGAVQPGEITAIRRASEAEIESIAEHSARQHLEDLKEDRRALDPGGFRARHLTEIREGHWWVAECSGRICFQVHVGPRSHAVVQLGGVFTPPDLRGRGCATRALRALVARLHADRPRVSLLCDESNHVACRLYERVGFRVVAHNHSYLLRGGRYA